MGCQGSKIVSEVLSDLGGERGINEPKAIDPEIAISEKERIRMRQQKAFKIHIKRSTSSTRTPTSTDKQE
jgi:hypothetical protein